MAIRTHIEQPTRGLVTALDPSLAPPGSLQLARNSRYRPADPSLWFADGRKLLPFTGGSGTVATALPLIWDPGSTVDGVNPELFQLFYVFTSEPSGLGTVSYRSIPLFAAPTDTRMDLSLARTYTATSEFFFAGSHFDYVGMLDQKNADLLTYFLFPSGTRSSSPNICVLRRATGQVLVRHGIPETAASPTYASWVTSPVGAWGAHPDYNHVAVFHWWVWYNSTDTHQGTTLAEFAPRTPVMPAQNRSIVVTIPYGTVPASATHLRVYRSSMVTEAPLNSGIFPNPFPYGDLILEVAVGSLSGGSYSFTDRGRLTVSPGANEAGRAILDAKGNASSFPFVQVRLGNEGVAVGKDGDPPLASTGDVFEESLCMNDVEDPRKLWFSYPGEPFSVPSLFYINFDTKESDRIVWIRSLGHVLGVGMENSIWRVNWLPRAADVEFNRGDVRNLVVEGLGATSPRGVARFSMPGVGPMLAWVSPQGLQATDLFRWFPLSDALEWDHALDARKLRDAILVNNPTEYRLELYCTIGDGFINDQVYYFHYHPSHVTGSQLKVTGPIERFAGTRAALGTVVDGNEFRVISVPVSPSHRPAYEGFGVLDEAEAGLPLVFEVRTREIYPAGIGNEFKVIRGLLHMKPSQFTSGTLQYTVEPDGGVGPELSVTKLVRRLESPPSISNAEFATLHLKAEPGAAGASVAVNSMGFEYEPLVATERA